MICVAFVNQAYSICHFSSTGQRIQALGARMVGYLGLGLGLLKY